LTGEEEVDAYTAWVILASKLEDLPSGARAYFQSLCSAVEEFDPHEHDEIALTNHLETPVIRPKSIKPLGTKSKHDYARVFDWVQDRRLNEGDSVEDALWAYVEKKELDAGEYDAVKRAYLAMRRARLAGMEQQRPHFLRSHPDDTT
tara:strand:+ start:5836 stop:6276 length:441 start_codon:yes stop_codon:yes gene_type:complete